MADAAAARRARLAALARHLPTFADPTVPIGEWHQPDAEPGSFSAASFELHPEAARFVEHCRAHGWVLSGFDWAAWAQTPEACRLRDDPTGLSRASEQQLAQLLTVVIRQQRFSEGVLAVASQSGLLHRVLKRAESLSVEVGHRQ